MLTIAQGYTAWQNFDTKAQSFKSKGFGDHLDPLQMGSHCGPKPGLVLEGRARGGASTIS